MHIILLILKIIGIVLLSLIGILLALILLGLFVPIRYFIKGEKRKDTPVTADIRLNWLLHIVSFTLEYKDKISYRLRILGITVLKGEEELSSEEKEGSPSKEEKQKSQKKKKQKSNKQASNVRKKSSSEPEHSKKRVSDNIEQANSKTASVQETIEELNEENSSQNEKQALETKASSVENTPLITEKKTQNSNTENAEQEIIPIKTGKTKIEQLWERICRFFIDGWNKIKELFYKAKRFCVDLCKKKDQAIEKLRMIKEFLYEPENKLGFLVLWKLLKKLGRHCGPKKWDCKVRFGTADPAQTGQILGIISSIGGMIGFMPDITPEFQEEVLDVDFFLKGRMQTYYLIWLIIEVWKNEDFHKLQNNFEKVRRNF